MMLSAFGKIQKLTAVEKRHQSNDWPARGRGSYE